MYGARRGTVLTVLMVVVADAVPVVVGSPARAQRNSRLCEGWKSRKKEFGGLEGDTLTFVGEGWPAQDQDDICNDMNRNDTVFEDNYYWLYDDNVNETAGVEFSR